MESSSNAMWPHCKICKKPWKGWDNPECNHTKNKMTSSIPKSIQINPDAEQLTGKQCASIINCLARDDQPINLKIHWSSGVRGDRGSEYIECSSVWKSGHYYFVLKYHGGMLLNCLWCKTPTGKEFNIETCEGDPFDSVAIEDRVALVNALLGVEHSDEDDWGVTLVPLWWVCVQGIGVDPPPYIAGLHSDKAKAEAALKEQIEYRREIILKKAHKNHSDPPPKKETKKKSRSSN